MDKSITRKEPTDDDMTRESLIAISYGLPEFDPTEGITLPKTIDGDIYAQTLYTNDEEKCRSELISISYAPPLESKVLPTASELAGL